MVPWFSPWTASAPPPTTTPRSRPATGRPSTAPSPSWSRAPGESGVEDVDGRRFLVLHGAISSVNQGHVHPSIRRVLVEQSGRVAMTSRSLRNDALGPFLRDLSERTGYARSILMNSGAEAVETAIKLARKWGHVVRGVPDGAQEIVVFGGNFHGRTTALASFSDSAAYRDGFGPLATGFVKVPFGDLDAARAPAALC